MLRPVGYGEGSLFRFTVTRRGRIYRYWGAELTVDGRRVRVSAKTRPAVREKLQKLRDERDDGTRRREQPTLGEYLTRWLDDVRPNLAPATWRKHESIVRTGLVPALGRIPLSALSVDDVRRYLAHLRVGPQTARHHRASLRRALADALRDGLVDRNVAALAEAPKINQEPRRHLTATECRALVDGTRDDRLWAFWVLAVTTGMREAEMLGLTWDDVDLAARQISIRRTLQRVDGEWQLRPPKTTKSRRTIPIPPLAVEALRQHRLAQARERAGAPEGLVFTTATGHPIHGTNLLPVLYAHEARLGLPRVGIHGLRHSAATYLIAAGVPIEKVAAILGHSSVRVTSQTYSHLTGADIREVADVAERVLT